MRICEIITSVWPYVTSISWHQRTRIRRKNKKVTFFLFFSVILIFLCNWKRNHFPYKMFLFLLSTRFMRWSKISYFLCSIKRRFSKFVFIIQVGGLFFLYIYLFFLDFLLINFKLFSLIVIWNFIDKRWFPLFIYLFIFIFWFQFFRF